jgi:hypothetical protein
MAYFAEVEVRIGWVPDGSGNTFLGQPQANIPGQGPLPLNNRVVFSAQVRQYIVGEGIPGGDSPTLANINTALTSCVADLAAASGTPQITAAELAIIQGWSTGNP